MENLHKLAGKHQLPAKTVLDFGAGHGRVSRFWLQYFEASEITVSEIKQQALEFQKKSFGFKAIHHTAVISSHSLQDEDKAELKSILKKAKTDGFKLYENGQEREADVLLL